jgi:hypothetical protein
MIPPNTIDSEAQAKSFSTDQFVYQPIVNHYSFELTLLREYQVK